MNNMTSLMSAFVRWYHHENGFPVIFSDNMAGGILTEKEKKEIADHLAQGIGFFNPSFEGTEEEAVKWIVNNRLDPSVLARSRFCEDRLRNAMNRGYRQYFIFGAGYDTFSFRNDDENLKVFELDLLEMIEDRIRRMEATTPVRCKITPVRCNLAFQGWSRALKDTDYDSGALSFGSMLGLSYYLSEDELKNLLREVFSVTAPSSEICFDYQNLDESIVTATNEKLAAGAGEEMKGRYTYKQMERLLSECGYLIYEHVDADEMNEMYFKYSRQMKAPEGVAYVLAVKKNIHE